MAYTYDDFISQAGDMLGSFSQYDLDLAKQHPEAGMAILQYKKDYNNATTKEAKLLANQEANQVRTSFGSYSGGGDGSKYYYNGTRADSALDRLASFGSFTDTTARPADYQSQYSGKTADLLGQIGGYGSFSYDAARPEYNNQYQQMQRQLLDSIINRPDFSWSKEDDPQWSSYKKQYLREGERATANALAQASAASGGRPSSFAMTAASQAGDYYAAQLSDIIPTLYQQAYDRYLQEDSLRRQDLGAVNQQEQLDYAKYLDQLGQFNTDRSFALDSWRTGLDALQSQLGAYQQMEQLDYQKYLDQLNQYNTDRNFAYNQYLGDYDRLQSQYSALAGREDAIYNRGQAAEQTAYERAWNEAEREYQRQQNDYERAWNEAERDYQRQQAAQALAQGQVDAILQAGGSAPGGLLSQSGYAPEYAQILEAYYRNQAAQAAAGRSSGGSSGGGEPALTWPQTLKQIEAGNLTPTVLAAYSYYMGQEYSVPQDVSTPSVGSYQSQPPTPTLSEEIGSSGTIPSNAGIGNYIQSGTGSDVQRIHVDGIGSVSWERLEALLKSGTVVERYNPATNKVTYVKAS